MDREYTEGFYHGREDRSVGASREDLLDAANTSDYAIGYRAGFEAIKTAAPSYWTWVD